MIVARAIYRDGQRVGTPDDLGELFAASRDPENIVWLSLHDPTEEESSAVASAFGLHALAVEDAVNARQRPKLEFYDDILFLVLRPARYIDETESVEFGEIHVFAGKHFVVTIRHGEASDLGGVRAGLEARPELLRRGTMPIVHAILDKVVDDYAPVVAGLENDIDEIEDDVFDGSADSSRRIYDLTREVIGFARAAAPLPAMIGELMGKPELDKEARRYLRDVKDHALHVQESVEGFRELLRSILNVNLTLETKALNELSVAQNEEVKKISAWAAILFAPSVVTGIYGMNFKHMPELKWEIGYPLALMLMLTVSLALYQVFHRRGWI